MNFNLLVRFSFITFFLFCAHLGFYAQNYEDSKRAEILVDTLDNFFIQDVNTLDFNKVEFFISEEDHTPILRVIENGLKHKNGVIRGTGYQETYKVNDNIELLGHSFKIKNIDLINSEVTIGEEILLVDIIYQSKNFDVSRYYDKKEYLFIYEWAPNNADSVDMLSILNVWHKKYCKCVSFLGVCYGSKKDETTAKKLWKKNKAPFKMIYIEKDLQNNDFPQFIILSQPWLNLQISGKEYLPVVIEELENIRERCQY